MCSKLDNIENSLRLIYNTKKERVGQKIRENIGMIAEQTLARQRTNYRLMRLLVAMRRLKDINK